ncbi:MAG: hypothetical protein ACRD50_09045 [Candidatus Acidiferrales bacterium]
MKTAENLKPILVAIATALPCTVSILALGERQLLPSETAAVFSFAMAGLATMLLGAWTGLGER